MHKKLVKKQAIEDAQDKMRKVVKEFSSMQYKYRKNINSIYEKMAFYSAGIISLSITFIGFLVSREQHLTQHFLCIPIYVYIYSSWIILAITIILSLLIKWIDSKYLFYNSQLNYHKSRKELEEKRIDFFKNYPNILFEKNSNQEKEIATSQKNIEILDSCLINKTSKRESRNFKLQIIFKILASVLFAAGILLLIIFAIASTFSLIQ